MKLIVAIVNYDDAGAVTRALTKAGFSTTKLATTGGFLLATNATILTGVRDERVQEAIDVIRAHSKSRKQVVPPASELGSGVFSGIPVEVTVGGATIFVVDVERFERV